MPDQESRQVVSSHPEVPLESKSDRKTVVLSFAAPAGAGVEPESYLAQAIQRIQPVIVAHEGTVRKTDPAELAVYVDLPRKQAVTFKLRALEAEAVVGAEFEDVTKPDDGELGVGE